jgi:putative NADPH-quinone reductase
VRRITVIVGHPDPSPDRFCHALAAAYLEGAAEAEHETRLVRLAEIDFPLLRSKEDWERGEPPPAIRPAQEALLWADHLVIVYPLWLGDVPALLKGFLEQALRPGLAGEVDPKQPWNRLLAGKSARVVVTMGMPRLIYRWFFGAHSLKSLKRSILRFSGVRPIRENVIGGVESIGDMGRRKWLDEMRGLGRSGG